MGEWEPHLGTHDQGWTAEVSRKPIRYKEPEGPHSVAGRTAEGKTDGKGTETVERGPKEG
jgi:hypothetical protein